MSESSSPAIRESARHVAIPFAIGVIALILFVIFRHQIVDWFTMGRAAKKPAQTQGHENHSGGGGGATDSADLPTISLPTNASVAIQRALVAYEAARQALAADSINGLDLASKELVAALETTTKAIPSSPETAGALFALEQALPAARALGTSPDAPAARSHFAQLSRSFVDLLQRDPSLGTGLHAFECTMTKGFNQWLQPNDSLENPYQGAAMLTCGDAVELGALPPSIPTTHEHAGADSEIAHYTCPMDTWVKAGEPGPCPVCGMDLVPVTQEEVRTGVMRIDHRRRQLIGIRTGLVEQRDLTANIKAIGRVVYDESRQSEVVLKYDGFIKRLNVNATGQYVKKGQVLFTIYSPELFTAQQDYLLAIRQRDTLAEGPSRARADGLVAAAAQRLSLWDVTTKQIAELRSRGTALENLAVLAPASGYVIDKFVVEGAAVRRGERLFRIAALDKIWIEADVYERDIPLVKVGQEALITLTHLPGKSFKAKVSFIYPYLDGRARTSRARLELDNRDLELKPDMYADVELRVPLGERLLVPESAVIYSGPRRIVFLDLDQDRLRPQEIQVGVKSNGYFEVISGLKIGDRVVTSGNFLLSAESRLKSATGLW